MQEEPIQQVNPEPPQMVETDIQPPKAEQQIPSPPQEQLPPSQEPPPIEEQL